MRSKTTERVTHKISLLLTDKQHGELLLIGRMMGISLSDVLRGFIDEYVETHAEDIDKFKQIERKANSGTWAKK